LRIVPAYLVCFLLCLLLEAPLAGSDVVFSPRSLLAVLPQVLTLSPPALPGVFSGLHYPLLNGAMWTIAYEFRCYLLTAVLGLMGIFRPRGRFVLAAVVAILLVMNATGALKDVRIHNANLVGGLPENIRFFAVFGVGALYYLFREWTELTNARARIAGVLLVALMFSPRLAEAAYAVLGGYLILWCALKLPEFRLSRLDDRADISYGLYLYAWPIQTLIIWHERTINPWLLCCITLVLASLLGFASWVLVEKPSMSLAVSGRASLA
jgi:peptidoglycan/LPS O-acetylase OafA/YrhL